MAATQKKPTSSTKKSTARKPSTNRTGSSNSRKKGNTGNKSGHTNNQYGLSRYRDEITIVITLVVAVILILSNFNLSGSVGAFINRFTFGMFGVLAYLLPYLLFFGIAFHISNKGNATATIKLISSICLVCMVAAFLQLVTIDYNEEWKIFNYYTNSATNKNGGGLIGGIIYSIMYPLFGFAGTLVILLAIMTLLIMFITERLFFASLGKKGAVKFSEMKARHQEIRKSKQESYYSEEYDDEEYEESNYEERDYEEKRGRKSSTRDYDRTNEVYEDKRNSKPERRRKAKTFTFPHVASETNSKIVEPVTADNVVNETSTTTVPMDEVKPFDFDSIPIHRGTSSYDYDETPVYKEEMKRKFSQGKDYDIKKLAQQIMNESFDGDSTKVDKDTVQYSTGVDDKSERDYFTPSMQEEKVDFDQSISSHTSLNQDKEEVNLADDYSESVDNDESSMNTAVDFTDFRVDLKMLENEEVKQTVEPHSSSVSEANNADNISYEESDSNTRFDKSDWNKTEMNKPEMNKPELKQSGPNQSSNATMNQNTTPVEIAEEEPFVYEFPPIELLSRPKKSTKGASDNELKETAIKLQQTLQSFGVGVTITNVSCGPAVTRYELQPEQGVKVSKITNLADDIKLNLAAADIRIEAPIPGKAAVGIEVPNKENSAVMFRELIEGKEFKEHASNLAFAVGKDIGGQIVVTDIAKMPHLLIAGATGSGKSVCINTLIMSILYKAHPDDVKLIMVDPKVVELSVYNGIPHLLIPVVTDPKKASAALNWAVMEMTDRYNRFAELGVRDIKGYNAKVEKVKEYQDEKFQKMPQIVIIVDELADLMMVAPGEVEDAICRLAQMARAAGIHLIIATQRPSVNVITGLIKANVPSRIAFSVSSAIDSRTIIDGSGAEKLLGKGDMLFFPSGYPKPVRIQGAFVSDKEVSEVVEFLASQHKKPTYNEDITNKITSVATSEGTSAPANDRDDYFVEAGKFIIDKNKASIGMLQRVYKIGFNRAARIMDQLYEAGVVGPEEGTKPRKVLMSEEEFEQYVDEYV